MTYSDEFKSMCKLAHEYDEKKDFTNRPVGWFTYIGMKQYAEDFLCTVSIEPLKYIVDTFLECYNTSEIDMLKFEDYLTDCCIIDEDRIPYFFPDLWFNADGNIERLCDILYIIYDKAFFTFDEGMYTMSANYEWLMNRNRLNIIGAYMEIEALMTLEKINEVTQEQINDSVFIINEYTNFSLGNKSFATADEVFKAFNNIFGGII